MAVWMKKQGAFNFHLCCTMNRQVIGFEVVRKILNFLVALGESSSIKSDFPVNDKSELNQK